MVPILRPTRISQINSALDNSGFSLRDFKVDVERNDYLVHIAFIPKPQYEFSIAERNFSVRPLTDFLGQTPADIRLSTTESPGEYKIKDIRTHDSIEQCISRITHWCRSIEEDLVARIPIQDELNDFEIEIERRINEAAGDSQDKFTESEISVLSKKLDGFASKFEELERANTITENELAEVRAEFEKIKGTLPIYPKSAWYKTAGHKLLDVTKRVLKTKESREFLLASAKKFFLGQD